MDVPDGPGGEWETGRLDTGRLAGGGRATLSALVPDRLLASGVGCASSDVFGILINKGFVFVVGKES